MMVGSAAELLQEIEREQHATAAKKQRKKKRKGKAAATAESPVAPSHEYPCRVHTDDDEQQAAQGQNSQASQAKPTAAQEKATTAKIPVAAEEEGNVESRDSAASVSHHVPAVARGCGEAEADLSSFSPAFSSSPPARTSPSFAVADGGEENEEGEAGGGEDPPLGTLSTSELTALKSRYEVGLRRVTAELAERRRKAVAAARREALSESLVCPISLALMRDPVVAADGHTYERCQIESWIQRAQRNGEEIRSPVTNEALAYAMLAPNHSMRSLIAQVLDSQQDQEALDL